MTDGIAARIGLFIGAHLALFAALALLAGA